MRPFILATLIAAMLSFAPTAHAHGHGVAIGGTVFVQNGFAVQAAPFYGQTVFVQQAPVVFASPQVFVHGGFHNQAFHNQAVVIQNGNAVTFARTGPLGVTRSTQVNGSFTRRGPLGFATTFQSNGVRVFTGPAGNIRGIR